MSIKRCVVLLAVASVVCALGAPAHARYGAGHVNTWVRVGDRVVGRAADGGTPPTMSVHLSPGVPRSVTWVTENLGGQPSTHFVGFEGCRSADGVGFRYFKPNGREVTWRVTHDGYSYHQVPKGQTRSLRIRLLAHRAGSDGRCHLDATGLLGVDRVAIHVSS